MRVIFNDPTTILIVNGKKYISKAHDEEFDEEKGLLMCLAKDNFDCDFTFNLEMIPAENCAGVICQADNLLFEQDKYFIYSNQWIPLTEKCTITPLR